MSSPIPPKASQELETAGMPPQQPPAVVPEAEAVPDAEPVQPETFPSGVSDLLRDLHLQHSPETATTAGPTPVAMPAGSRHQGEQMLERTAIPGYAILGELGRGGMGVVYKARQVGLNRIVALKTIRGNRVGEKDIARFLIEAEAVAAIEHPNVVRVYDYGDHNGYPYMALEYLPGGTLAERLDRETRLSAVDAAQLVCTISRGVAAAHALRIVHRDLKPGNILFTADNAESGASEAQEFESIISGASTATRPNSSIPKVADFGLAKRGTSDLTQTQAVMGTPAYMAPEQADGKTKFVGPTADVWALGVILYECVHGERPFQAPNVHGLLEMIRSAEVPVPKTYARVPRELDLICRKCLEKNPADRYPSATELADDLERFVNGEPVSVRPLGNAAKGIRWAKRNPVVAGLMGLILLSMFGLIGLLYAGYRQAEAHAEFERGAKEDAEKLKEVAEKAAKAELARRKEAERLQKLADTNAALANTEAVRANEVIAFMMGLFKGSDPLDLFGENVMPQSWEKQRLKTADVLLWDAAAKFKSTDVLKDQPLSRAKLLSAVANSMTNLGDYKNAEPLLKESLALRRASLPADHADVILNELDLGRLYWNMGDFVAALESFRGALDKQRRTNAPESVILTTRFFEALTLTFIDPRQADPVFREVIEGRERLRGPNHHETITAYIGYAAMLLDDGRTVDLLPILPKIVEPLKSHPNPQFRSLGEVVGAFQTGVGYAHMANSTPALAESFRRQAEEKLREALKKGEVALPVDHWIVEMIRFELALVLVAVGKEAEADVLYGRIIADMRKTVGFAHPKIMIFGHVVGKRWARSNKLDEARKLWEDIDGANLRQFGPENHWRAKLLLARVKFEAEYGTVPLATQYAKEALGLIHRGRMINPRAETYLLMHAGEQLARPNMTPEGRTVVRDLFATCRKYINESSGAQSRDMCIALRVEGEKLFTMGDRNTGAARLASAEPLAKLLEAGEDDSELHDLWAALGKVENARGNFAKAEKHYSDALAMTRRNDWRTRFRTADAWGLVEAFAGQRKYSESASVLQELRKWKLAEKAPELDLTWVELWLAGVQFASGDQPKYRETLLAMQNRAATSQNVNTLARTAWIAGMSRDASPRAAGELAKQLAVCMDKNTDFAWGYWSLALISLRAGDATGADDACRKALAATLKGREWPVADLIQGLCAAQRGDAERAGDHLRRAEEFIARLKPSEQNRFAFATVSAHDRLLTELLLAELQKAVEPKPIAPPPREVP